MNRVGAWAVLLGMALATAAAFWLPAWALAAATVAAFAAMRRGRIAFTMFVAITLALDALLLAWATPGSPAWELGPVHLSQAGAMAGIVGGLRLSAILGVNLLALSWISPARLIDGLHLPPRGTAFLAAILISAQELGRDASRIFAVQQVNQGKPSRWESARRAAAIVPILLVLSVERANIRRDALHVAGIAMPRWFVPVVALSALALAGRLAFVAIPNVALTFVVIFAGGLVFGGRVAASAAVIAMTISDIILSGWLPTSFVNVPAMALVGMLGGALRHVDFDGGQPRVGSILAGGIGIGATLGFSVVADATEWLIVPEFRGNLVFLEARIASGLAFNVLPALVNGVLFGSIVLPVQRAFRSLPWPSERRR